MLRTIVLIAGLGAALVTGGLVAGRGEAIPDADEIIWVEQHVQGVTSGQTYRLDGCLTVTGTGLMSVSLNVAWYEQTGGFGSTLYQDDAHADIWRVGEQCLTLTNALAPCAARSVRYGVMVSGDTDAVSVDSPSLQLSAEPDATSIACPTEPLSPTPTPTATPTATATATATTAPQPSPAPTSAPVPSPAPSPPEPVPTTQAAEPRVFPSLVNGGFEDVREDGTPYGWRKVGGEMSASKAFRAEGERSVALVSRTASTKWIYQTVSVQGGAFYRLSAAVLKNDPGVREALLRVSWYESADGSGSQIGTADSPALAEDSPGFVTLGTGQVQAPLEARSAKVRLLMRPSSAAPAVVYFDAVGFEETEAPAAMDTPAVTDTPTAMDTPTATSTGGSGQAGRPRGGRDVPAAAAPGVWRGPTTQAEAAALDVWRGPTTLANVRQKSGPQASPDAGGGRPLWPLLLALGVPAAALFTVGGHAWWRASRGS